MEYDKYIELFSEASNVNIEDLLEPDLYRKITRSFEKNYHDSVKKDFIDKMLSFTHKGDIKNYKFRALEKQLLRQYLWTGLDIEKKHYDIFHFLFIHNGVQDSYSEIDDDWVNAIAMALYLFDKKLGYEQDETSIRNTNAIIYESVLACKFFSNKDFNISVKRGVIKLNNVSTIFDFLKSMAKNLGYFSYVLFIDSLIKPILDKDIGIYKFLPSISYQNGSFVVPYPYGLIFQLSLKYIHLPSVYKKDEEIKKEYIRFLIFSQNYASLFELQGFSNDFEMVLMRDTDNLFNKIKSIAQQDSFYKIEQYIPNDIFDFVKYISSMFIDNIECKEMISKFNSVVEIIKIKSYSGDIFFLKEDLPEGVDEFFLKRFTFNKANKDFNKLDDFDKIDFNYFILVEFEDRYNIVHLPFSIISLYRILYKLIEDCMEDSSNLSSDVGDYIENYLELKMQEKGFNAIHGRNYKVSKPQRNILNIASQQLECDIVINSDKYIVFMELKKKELTKIAKKGNIFYLLRDLSLSLLDSQYQANKHMRYITKFEEIKFYRVRDSNQPEVTISLEDKEILKVSISSLDYLSLHSKDVFHKFIRLLYNKEIVLSNEYSIEEHDSIRRFNESNYKLSKELYNESSKYQLEEELGFYNSYFLNVFHIIFMINKSDNSEQFIDLLLKSRTFITPYRDFYHDLMYRISISEKS